MRQRLVYLLPLAVLVVIAVAAGYMLLTGKDPKRLPSVLLNKPIPEFRLNPIAGFEKGFGTDDLKGQVTLVNIFGSWCVACLSEHPFLMRIKDEGWVPVYGVDWRETDREAGPKWLERHGNPYTLIGDDPDSEAAIGLGVSGAPESFVVDAQGIIRYKFVGPIDAEAWEETLWPLIQSLRNGGAAQ
jgi:cytochrome c biogenesis protein CcmG/thiol:disulfide interchange protein DsbE